MKHDNNLIEFELNENLYLKTGQEIAELVSISLDPNISVQSFDEYIQVRGLILLQGEYRRVDESEERENVEDSTTVNYIDSVLELQDGLTQFSHRLPIDISIPAHRVDNLQDITVNIDSFDYELPTTDSLKLAATVHIKGITSENRDEMSTDEKAENDVGDDNLQYKTQSLQEEEKTRDIEQTEMTQDEEVVQEVDSKEVPVENAKQVDEDEPEKVEQMEVIDSSTKTEPVKQVDDSTDDLPLAEEGVTEEAEIEQTEMELVDDESEQSQNKNEIDIQLSESETDEDNEQVQDVQFLTDLFGGDEEEVQTKVRIYITQEDDTIESIAKRYEMSTLQLIKDNNISGADLEEGQLLHISVQTEE